jgi:hypothetical protein
MNNFTFAGEHWVTSQAIKDDLWGGSNMNYSIQDPPNKNHIKIFHNLPVDLTIIIQNGQQMDRGRHLYRSLWMFSAC